MKHCGRILLTVGLTLVLLLLSLPVNLIGAQSNALGTGLKEPGAAQKNWIKDNFPVIQKIHLNHIALDRINAERAKKGLPALSQTEVGTAPVGQELVMGALSDRGTVGAAVGSLPGGVDNSLSPAFPPIRSQGSLGSCAAWATTYYQFTYENNLARGRTASGGDNTVIFSPKWTYNMINGGANNGAYFSDTYALEMKNGAPSWAVFPYDSNYLAWDLDPAAWRDALNYRPAGQGQIYNSNIETVISDVKTQLANGHVLVIGTYVYSWVQNVISNDPVTADDDAFTGQKIAGYMTSSASGGHAMTVVGYNDSIWVDLNGNGAVDNAEKGAFKIANSWGTADWNGGYRWVSYDALRTTSLVPAGANWPAANRASGGIFWNGNIFTLTANSTYSPTLVAKVTLNQATRNQMSVGLGTGAVTASQPSAVWNPAALQYDGGAYAFDGSTTSVDATFVLDFSDLALNSTGNTRWFVGISDSAAGNTTTLKSYQLYRVDGSGDTLVGSAVNLPQSVDGGKIYSWIDYAANSLNQSPVANISASSTGGNLPLTVNFSAAASSDADGSIASYNWSFGDGSTASGVSVAHTYTAAGAFTARLTVTDNQGATGTAGIVINVVNANVLNAPTLLTARASLKTVTLTWKDNSSNETGFYLERGTKVKNVTTFKRVATLASNVTTYKETLTSGSYIYRVQAFNLNTGITSPYSNQVNLQVK